MIFIALAILVSEKLFCFTMAYTQEQQIDFVAQVRLKIAGPFRRRGRACTWCTWLPALLLLWMKTISTAGWLISNLINSPPVYPAPPMIPTFISPLPNSPFGGGKRVLYIKLTAHHAYLSSSRGSSFLLSASYRLFTIHHMRYLAAASLTW